MADKGGGQGKASAIREARRAAELRANLKKRKDLARARAGDAKTEQPGMIAAEPRPFGSKTEA